MYYVNQRLSEIPIFNVVDHCLVFYRASKKATRNIMYIWIINAGFQDNLTTTTQSSISERIQQSSQTGNLRCFSTQLLLIVLVTQAVQILIVGGPRHILNKLKSKWTENGELEESSLSNAGNLVLIRLSLTVIPKFSVNCFKIPKIYCNDIDRTNMIFFYDRNNGQPTIQTVGWARICRSKCERSLVIKKTRILMRHSSLNMAEKFSFNQLIYEFN